MKAKQYSYREFERIIKDNGYSYVRSNGDHNIFENDKGNIISVPYPKVNAMVARRLIKENNLVVK